MTEFAAKVRARFRRRHSAMSGLGGLPAMGIPSLLSRSSARSSSGSHASSGSTTNTNAVADFGSRPESRHRDRDRDRDRGAAAEGGLAAAAVAADDQHDDKGATVAHEPQTVNDVPVPNDNNNASSCDIPPGSSSGLSSSLSPAHQTHPDIDDNNNININDTAVKSTDTPATAATTSITATTTITGPAAAPAPPEATDAQPRTALATGHSPAGPDSSSENSDMAGFSARTNNQQLLPSIHEQELLGLANTDADADAASIISSRSADLDPAHLLSPQARYRHHLSHLHNSQLNPHHQLHRSLPSSQSASPLSATAPASPSKKHHHNHHQRPRTPKNSGGRPLHIALPPASFGPPSNLSPNSIYSASASAGPTSPLGRYSSTLSATATGQTLAPTSAASALPPSLRSRAPIRRQSLVSNRQSALIQTLLQDSHLDDVVSPTSNNHNNSNHNNSLNPDHLLPISASMVTRKIWVKRPGGSATLVTIHEDDVVDDVRDMVLRKYANSLGRQFDAPDIILRIRPGSNQQERNLGPEEPMARTLDAYFPTGQTVDDALIIDVPLRRTPRASPRAGPPHAPHIQYYVDESRPLETANDYFGPGAISTLPVTVTAPSTGSSHPHAISVLSTGQVPQIPSPGSGAARARTYRERPERPRLGRQHTSSPTLINMSSGAAHQGSILAAAAAAPHGTQPINLIHHSHTSSSNKSSRSRTHSEASEHSSQVAAGGPQPPPLPTPPGGASNIGVDGGPGVPGVSVVGGPGVGGIPQRAATPPPRVSSPRLSAKPKKKKIIDHPALPKGMLNGSVPPINVLIVEDNIINLKLLEAFVKRLKVRWSTAMNGRDAVHKWRNGGFHLVLMDIQLPVMSGLDATREIRRLERVNSIGVFSSAASTAPEEVKGEPDEKDKLGNMDLFKSPVIIVALTASSLQSDRHEALAAGCNDFLTKPVNFVWLERKVMEWGCMQALIDFDGWRKWKDFAQQANTGSAADDKAKSAASKTTKSKKARSGLAQAVSATA